MWRNFLILVNSYKMPHLIMKISLNPETITVYVLLKFSHRNAGDNCFECDTCITACVMWKHLTKNNLKKTLSVVLVGDGLQKRKIKNKSNKTFFHTSMGDYFWTD